MNQSFNKPLSNSIIACPPPCEKKPLFDCVLGDLTQDTENILANVHAIHERLRRFIVETPEQVKDTKDQEVFPEGIQQLQIMHRKLQQASEHLNYILRQLEL